jgi:tetratricopeptide (TPR) repeat protein
VDGKNGVRPELMLSLLITFVGKFMRKLVKRLIQLGLAALLALLVMGSALAQDDGGTQTASLGSIDPASMSIPPSVKLEGLDMVFQQLNRCSAGALTIALSYYDEFDGDYGATIRGLNPNSEDVSVRLDEMIRFVRGYGLEGIERTGGTIELLKLLVANGFPVLVENSYYDGEDLNHDWMSHNRIIMGYDDAQGILYSFDSLLGAGEDGAGRAIAYDDFDNRWRAFNRDFLIVYQPGDEVLLETLLGEHYWDAAANAEWTLQQADAELAGEHPDSYATFNRGTALVVLGRYEEAAEAFDTARGTGLPWRFMWYQFGPFEAYLQVGRYDDVITLARTILDGTPGVEEIYYYLGRAYEAQGDLERAQANYEVAAQRNTNFTAAIDALAALENGTE